MKWQKSVKTFFSGFGSFFTLSLTSNEWYRGFDLLYAFWINTQDSLITPAWLCSTFSIHFSVAILTHTNIFVAHTLFENSLKDQMRLFLFWHFPPIFVQLKLNWKHCLNANIKFSKTHQNHSVWKSPKMLHLNNRFLKCTNFCLIKIDQSDNTV